MSNVPHKIFLLGATGYLGGTFLDALLKHPNVAQFDITVYIRSEEKAKQVEALGLGVKVVTGGLDDVEDGSSRSTIIINFASSDDLPLTEAILVGAKRAFASTNVPPIIIHASGAAIFGDAAHGQYASDKIYDDADDATLDALPATAIHRNVDIPLAAAHDEGYVKAYVAAPPLFYGLATGVLVDAGIQNPVPLGVSLVCDYAVARGGVFGLVGPNKNISTLVEIHDLTKFFITLFDAVLDGKQIAGGKAYYSAVDGEVVTRDYMIKIAEALHEFGYLKTKQTTEYTQEEIAKWPILNHFGMNFRISDSRGRSLGWSPTHTSPQDFLNSIRESVWVLVNQGEKFGYLGGTWLDRILGHAKANEFDITVYVRSPEKAKRLEEALGLNTVSGPLSAVEKAAEQADIIINCASSDDLPLTEAILTGAKKQHTAIGVRPVLIHVVSGYITSYIVYPAWVYGIANGKLVDLGLQNPAPTAINIVSSLAIRRGTLGGFGPMKNIWNVVDVLDTVDFFMIIFNAVIEGKPIASGPDGHYFLENGDAVIGDVFRLLAQTLHKLGVLNTDEITEFEGEEVKLAYPFGTNSRTTSTRSRSLGWKPVKTQQDFFNGLETDVKAALEWNKTH
ncbi:hypothetical protein BXZ70DRAFT_1033990 [Cristinia sonorae]|uniref:NmrA-like domain-containing protein n=1 Tax=Cristinia sonorae TaxID=1940300 RepID=A0A8K0UJG6_9AGAR|nr:hypothetical protein BXZ70DRAFT_1033990 [Cristinia sonorae]